MDGQNANSGGYPQNQQNSYPNNFGQPVQMNQMAPQQSMQQPMPPAQPTQPTQSGKSFFIFGRQPQKLENLRSSSAIMNNRDNVQQRLAALQAQNEAAIRNERRQAQAEKAARGTIGVVKVALVVIAIVLVLCVGFFVLQGMGVFRSTSQDDGAAVIDDGDGEEKGEIGGYKCKTSDCAEIVDLPDGRKLIRDEHYLVLDPATNVTTLTTIADKDYKKVSPLKWGEDLVLVLTVEENAKKALYSVSENRLLIDFKYDDYLTDSSDVAYNDQSDIVGNYIIAKTGIDYRLVRLSDGAEMAHGAKRVFKYDGFFIGIEDDGRKYVNAGGEQFLVAEADDVLLVHKSSGYLLHFTVDASGSRLSRVFNKDGVPIEDKDTDEVYAAIYYLEDSKDRDEDDSLKLFSTNEYARIPLN